MLLIAAVILAAPAPPDRILSCRIGAKQLEVTGGGDSLTYRFGPPGKPEITIIAGTGTKTVFYHRTMYARGEDQTLRFVKADYSYVVYSRWRAPSGHDAAGMATVPEYNGSGVLVMRAGRIVARLKCQPDSEMREWPVFFRLPADAENRVPEDA